MLSHGKISFFYCWIIFHYISHLFIQSSSDASFGELYSYNNENKYVGKDSLKLYLMSLNAFDILYFWYYFHKMIRNRIWSRFQRLHAMLLLNSTVLETSLTLGPGLFYSLRAHLIVVYMKWSLWPGFGDKITLLL